MQIRTFSIPIQGGEQHTEELNRFLRSKKILRVREFFVNNEAEGVFWCYSVRYVDDIAAAEREKIKVDYSEILDKDAFKRYNSFREIRKRVAVEDAVPAYIENELRCSLKPMALNRTETGLPFLGYHIFPHHVRLLQKSKQRFIKKLNLIQDAYHSGEWEEAKCQRLALPLLAFAKHADAKRLRKSVLQYQ